MCCLPICIFCIHLFVVVDYLLCFLCQFVTFDLLCGELTKCQINFRRFSSSLPPVRCISVCCALLSKLKIYWQWFCTNLNTAARMAAWGDTNNNNNNNNSNNVTTYWHWRRHTTFSEDGPSNRAIGIIFVTMQFAFKSQSISWEYIEKNSIFICFCGSSKHSLFFIEPSILVRFSTVNKDLWNEKLWFITVFRDDSKMIDEYESNV